MMGRLPAALVVLACLAAAGCVRDPYGYRRHEREDHAWAIVRDDPCRYAEYERFAHDHKNPEKRQRFVERLAREGCKSERRRDKDWDDDDRD